MGAALLVPNRKRAKRNCKKVTCKWGCFVGACFETTSRRAPFFSRAPLPGLHPDTLSHSKSITEVIRVLQEPVPPNNIVLLNAGDAYEFHNDYSDLSSVNGLLLQSVSSLRRRPRRLQTTYCLNGKKTGEAAAMMEMMREVRNAELAGVMVEGERRCRSQMKGENS